MLGAADSEAAVAGKLGELLLLLLLDDSEATAADARARALPRGTGIFSRVSSS